MADREGKKDTLNKVQKAVIAIAETQEGQIFFNWLMNRCYFQKSTVVGDPASHEINIHGTLFNEASRRVYLDIRRGIPSALLKKIEHL